MTTKNKLLFIPIGISVYFLYAFLHESGHAIFMLLFGAQINDFNFIFAPHVSGTFLLSSTPLKESLVNAAGVLFPTSICFIILCTYKYHLANFKYHFFCIIYTIVVLASDLSWVIGPLFLMSKQIDMYASDDIEKFIYNSNVPPLLVSLMSLLVVLLIGYLAFRKKVFHKYLELFFNRKY